jgi:hypothetical protein
LTAVLRIKESVFKVAGDLLPSAISMFRTVRLSFVPRKLGWVPASKWVGKVGFNTAHNFHFLYEFFGRIICPMEPHGRDNEIWCISSIVSIDIVVLEKKRKKKD